MKFFPNKPRRGNCFILYVFVVAKQMTSIECRLKQTAGATSTTKPVAIIVLDITAYSRLQTRCAGKEFAFFKDDVKINDVFRQRRLFSFSITLAGKVGYICQILRCVFYFVPIYIANFGKYLESTWYCRKLCINNTTRITTRRLQQILRNKSVREHDTHFAPTMHVMMISFAID